MRQDSTAGLQDSGTVGIYVYTSSSATEAINALVDGLSVTSPRGDAMRHPTCAPIAADQRRSVSSTPAGCRRSSLKDCSSSTGFPCLQASTRDTAVRPEPPPVCARREAPASDGAGCQESGGDLLGDAVPLDFALSVAGSVEGSREISHQRPGGGVPTGRGAYRGQTRRGAGRKRRRRRRGGQRGRASSGLGVAVRCWSVPTSAAPGAARRRQVFLSAGWERCRRSSAGRMSVVMR